LAALAGAGLAGAVLFAWLGLYNVAASTGHFVVIDHFLRFGMENSVETHAPDIEAPDLADPDLIRLGAGHYYAGCAYCHGAPGLPISPVSNHMLPPPPDLAGRVGEWDDQELFFIVKHGFKYTGMPGWPVLDRDDEVWAMVAFLRKLPGLGETQYRDLAMGPVEIEPQGGEEIATGSADSAAIAACARCHGKAGEGPQSGLVPRLHGQPKEMLTDALHQYVDHTRSSGVMQTAAHGLKDDEIERLAAYYAGLKPLSPASTGIGDAARGRELALRGDPDREIPACISCHAGKALQAYPRLFGQNARYMQMRLRGWRNGQHAMTETARIMAPIARELNPSQIDDVAAYFATAAEPAEAAQ
jgi:cytochrome c553